MKSKPFIVPTKTKQI